MSDSPIASRRDFGDFFRRATTVAPFPFQQSFAEAVTLPELVRVPTGLGKTAMAVIGWLWRRLAAGEGLRATTPRRLVYCLPMRVLVEQIAINARGWVQKLRVEGELSDDIPIHVLMGGEEEEDWDIYLSAKRS
jgi:CRISPR-associated endonuclease/helicase Cas3